MRYLRQPGPHVVGDGEREIVVSVPPDWERATAAEWVFAYVDDASEPGIITRRAAKQCILAELRRRDGEALVALRKRLASAARRA